MKRRNTAAPRASIGKATPVLALVLLAGPAGAQEQRAVVPVFDAGTSLAQGVREPARVMAEDTTDRIVRQMEKKYGAKLTKNPKERVINGRRVLELTLLDDKKGRVFPVRVDIETGKELKEP